MIAEDRTELVQSLLARGLSYEKIARRVLVSVSTVRRIAERVTNQVDKDEVQNYRRAKRCNGCGWLIYQWPCLNCQIQHAHE